MENTKNQNMGRDEYGLDWDRIIQGNKDEEKLRDAINNLTKEGLFIWVRDTMHFDSAISQAREEGRREVLEQIQRVLEDEMLVIAKDGTGIVEKYINEWLNNLSDKRV